VLWARQWPDRTWAIESAAGLGYLLAQQLVAAGERVLDGGGVAARRRPRAARTAVADQRPPLPDAAAPHTPGPTSPTASGSPAKPPNSAGKATLPNVGAYCR
jgi:hypothetical protein